MNADDLAKERLENNRNINLNKQRQRQIAADRKNRSSVYQGYNSESGKALIKPVGGSESIEKRVITTGYLHGDSIVRTTRDTVDGIPAIRKNEDIQPSIKELIYPFKAITSTLQLGLDRKTRIDLLLQPSNVLGLWHKGLKKDDWEVSFYRDNSITFLYPIATNNQSILLPSSTPFTYKGYGVWNTPIVQPNVSQLSTGNNTVVLIDTVTTRITEQTISGIRTAQADWNPYLFSTNIGNYLAKNKDTTEDINNNHWVSGEPIDYEYRVPYTFIVDASYLSQQDNTINWLFNNVNKFFIANNAGLAFDIVDYIEEKEKEEAIVFSDINNGYEVHIQLTTPGGSDRFLKEDHTTKATLRTTYLNDLYVSKYTGNFTIASNYTRPYEQSYTKHHTKNFYNENASHTNIDTDYIDRQFYYERNRTGDRGYTEIQNNSELEIETTIQQSQDIALIGKDCLIFNEITRKIVAATSPLTRTFNRSEFVTGQGIGSFQETFEESQSFSTENILHPSTTLLTTYLYIATTGTLIELQKLPYLFGDTPMTSLPAIGDFITFSGSSLFSAPSAYMQKKEFSIVSTSINAWDYIGINEEISDEELIRGNVAPTQSTVTKSYICTSENNLVWSKIIGSNVAVSAIDAQDNMYSYKGVVTAYTTTVGALPSSSDDMVTTIDLQDSSITFVGSHPVQKYITSATVSVTTRKKVPYVPFGASNYLTLFPEEGDYSIRGTDYNSFRPSNTNLIAVPPPATIDPDTPYVAAKLYHTETYLVPFDLAKKKLYAEVYNIMSDGIIRFSHIGEGAIHPIKNAATPLTLLYHPAKK